MMTALEVDEHALVGIQEGLSPEAYHSSPGISFTGYKEFIKSPLHFKTRREKPLDSTPAQIKGQLTHCFGLEPDQVEKRFMRVGARANPKLKEKAEELGLIAVNDNTWADAEAMGNAVRKHPDAKLLIETGKCEVSFFWWDPVHNILRRCRTDVWHAATEIVADLKYVGDASEAAFEKMCVRQKYHLQSPWYLDVVGGVIGKRLHRHVHICVEDEPPYAVQLHALSDHDLEQSRHAIDKGLERYAECLRKNEWPSYETGVRTMVLPHWAYTMTDEGEVLA